MDQSTFSEQTVNLINEALDTALDTVAQEDDLFPFVLTINACISGDKLTIAKSTFY